MSFDERKAKMEKKESLLREEEPLYIEPREVKSASKDIPKDTPPVTEPDKHIEVSSPVPSKIAEAKLETFVKPAKKSSPFFGFLFGLSFAFMAIAAGLLLFSILNISLPPFFTSVINFISSK